MADNNDKSLFSEAYHIKNITKTIGGNGSTVVRSLVNGKIKVDNVDVLVYDDTDIQSEIDGKASIVHSHAISEVTGLNTALNEKASTTHGHAISEITGLDSVLNEKANTSHSHALANMTDVDTTSISPNTGDFLSYQTGKWRPVPAPSGGGGSSTATNVYVIELSRWGIKSDGTNPIATTQGINDALLWANQNGYTYVKLPAGTYTVGKGTMEKDFSTTACIQPQSNMTIDLYGCTIQKETNGWEQYRVIYMVNKSNITFLGGNIVGDYLTHDYTSAGIHEGAIGIHVSGGSNITLYQMDISGFAGYSVCFAGNGGQVVATSSIDWESGAISTANGSLVTNANYMRMNKYVTLASMKYQPATQYVIERGTDLTGAFYLWGNGYGAYATRYDGKPANFSTVVFELHFYDDANAYKGTILTRGFDPVPVADVPTGSTKFKIACRYDLSKLIPSTVFLQIQALNISRGIRVLNCKIHDGYALAIAITGSQHILVDQCEMYNIGFAQAKMGRRLYPFPMAIDIEDLTNVNQHIIIRGCIFKNNEGLHISVVHGRNITLEYNKFDPVGSGANGVGFQGSRGTSLVSRYNTYTGCTAGGEGAGFVHFHRDNFIEATVGINYESIYEGCIFDNSGIQIAMTNLDTFSASSKYLAGNSVLPTTLNGFYYVCTARPATEITQTEPNWSLALTEGAEFTLANGYTWRAFIYNPIYPTVTFKDCKFTYNKPEIAFGWLNRRGNVDLISCKFDVISGSGYFSDNSTGWDLVGNNEWTVRDCEITGTSNFGFLKGKKITIERTKLKGSSATVTPLAYFDANDLTVSRCTFDNFNGSFRGNANSIIKNIKFFDNVVNIDKAVRTFGATNEGLSVRNFDNVFIESNKFFMTNATILNRPLTIYAEKLIKITDNHFESANSANTIELFPANRAGSYSGLALPKTTEIFDRNSIVKISLQKDATYIPQIGKTLGNGFTDLNATSIGLSSSVSAIPASGVFALGQIIPNSAPVSGGSIGWICVTTGIANNQSWTASKAYVLGNQINANGHVYEVTVAGTSSASSPTFPITSGATVVDGGVTWKEVGILAVLKEFGLISI